MCGRCLFKCCEPMRMSLYDICNKRHVKHLSDSFEISPPRQTKNTDPKKRENVDVCWKTRIRTIWKNVKKCHFYWFIRKWRWGRFDLWTFQKWLIQKSRWKSQKFKIIHLLSDGSLKMTFPRSKIDRMQFNFRLCETKYRNSSWNKIKNWQTSFALRKWKNCQFHCSI